MSDARALDVARARTRWTVPGATVGVTALGAFLVSYLVGLPAVLFSGLLAAVLAVAWLESRRNLRPHVADLSLPDRVAWGAAFHALASIRPAPGTSHASRDVVLSLGLRDQSPRPIAYLSRLSPSGLESVRPVLRSFERGRCRAWTMALETTYPFGLFGRRLVLAGACDLLVLPRVGRIRGFEMMLGRALRARPQRHRPTFGEEDLKALREWRPGNSRRRIAWKVSARRGTTVVRELEEPTEPSVHLVFDTRTVERGERRGKGGKGRRATAAFERAVRLTASLVESFRRTRRDHAFTILDADGATPVPSRSRRGGGVALDVLAEVAPATGGVDRALPIPARGRASLLVLVCVGKPGGEERVAEEVDLLLDVTGEETLAWLRDGCGWAEE